MTSAYSRNEKDAGRDSDIIKFSMRELRRGTKIWAEAEVWIEA